LNIIGKNIKTLQSHFFVLLLPEIKLKKINKQQMVYLRSDRIDFYCFFQLVRIVFFFAHFLIRIKNVAGVLLMPWVGGSICSRGKFISDDYLANKRKQ